MKVWVLHLDEATQVCSTKEKAIEAARTVIEGYPTEGVVESIKSHDDYVSIDFSYREYVDDDSRILDTCWIYLYEVDGGPIC